MAGVSAKEIKNRIRSMEATRKITRAMELVAASKLRRAQEQMETSRPYFQSLQETMEQILTNNQEVSSPYLRRGGGARVLYIVIAGDRGLAGGYNSNILKLTVTQIRDRDVLVLPIGRKAVDFFRSRRTPLFTERYTEAADMDMGDCFCVSKEICSRFLGGEFAEVRIVSTTFVSALSQVPADKRLLPLTWEKSAKKRHIPCETVYEPNAEEVFASIVPMFLGGSLFESLCESHACEAAARRTAMDSATQNADEMIGDLGLKFNRVRQSAITREITEIVAGS